MYLRGIYYFMDIEEYLRRIKVAESGGNPFAVNKQKGQTASGLYQFTKRTWTKGLGYDWNDRFDVNKQQEAATRFTKSNIEGLKKAGVKDPTYSDMYGAHIMGLYGYKEFLKHSDETPVSEFMKQSTIDVNPNMLFDPKTGRVKTVSEVRGMLAKKVGEPSKEITRTIERVDIIPDLSPKEVKRTEDESIEELNKESYHRDKVDLEMSFLQPDDTIPEPTQKRATPILNATQAQEIEYTPLYQNGGNIPISKRGMYEFPNQQVVVPTDGSITMKNISYPIIGTSIETGETRLMQPDREYFFKNTKNVLETPTNEKKK